jgi:hypothetical protein
LSTSIAGARVAPKCEGTWAGATEDSNATAAANEKSNAAFLFITSPISSAQVGMVEYQ